MGQLRVGRPRYLDQKGFMAVDGNITSQSVDAAVDPTDKSCWLVLHFGRDVPADVRPPCAGDQPLFLMVAKMRFSDHQRVSALPVRDSIPLLHVRSCIYISGGVALGVKTDGKSWRLPSTHTGVVGGIVRLDT